MTAQAGESLFYKGEVTWMAVEPLNQYLQNRNDIKFISPSTACWRGYIGQWEIKDNKLYLIGLNAYIEGYREVGLNYLFPGQIEVFANWFNGKIRIPQGEMLEYVHSGYASMYESDLFLVVENGILVNQYEVDNREEYQNRLKQREQKKKYDKMIAFIANLFLIFVFMGICIGIYYLIKWDNVIGYFISAIIVSGMLYLFLLAIKNRIKNK
ncbi:MAG: hypothetical protein IT266_03995 [Saprospiraceae bacterium]|nr:hypothetical protein [Saprospiraceae bacterium]